MNCKMTEIVNFLNWLFTIAIAAAALSVFAGLTAGGSRQLVHFSNEDHRVEPGAVDETRAAR